MLIKAQKVIPTHNHLLLEAYMNILNPIEKTDAA